MTYERSRLWRRLFEDVNPLDPNIPIIGRLAAIFKEIRGQVSLLVNEIAIDLPAFTVHDVNHLDALWLIADQILGDDYALNPLEAFVLGCSFLFHDSGMTLSAYPGGLQEVKETSEWKKTYQRLSLDDRIPHQDLDVFVLQVFLREQHAKRAEALPFVEWSSRDGHQSLIENVEIRQKLGQFIGQLSASHWWDHDTLVAKLNRRVPSPTSFPADWSIDLLKIAAVLRCSDAASIDSVRAPGFLWALRKARLNKLSNKHWSFQNKLTQPERRGDALYYASTADFIKEESDEWWLAYDSLKVADNELKKVDSLLAYNRGENWRFAAKRIANIESPTALTDLITVRGWKPVDTAFSISDIPRLVDKLGGEQLYGGDNFAPLRELIINAMDAIRLRRFLDPDAPEGLVRVEVTQRQGTVQLSVTDNGVGMSADLIVKNLLSFGSSGWLADPAIGEFNNSLPKVGDVAGRFGIGFFSIFMLGKKVKVSTKRFDEGAQHTTILEFMNGLEGRPILSSAEGEDRKTSAGTTILVEFQDSPSRRNDIKKIIKNGNFLSFIKEKFPAADVKISIIVDGDESIVDGTSWRHEDSYAFLKRIEVARYDSRLAAYDLNIRPIYAEDGNLVGRMCLVPQFHDLRFLDYDKEPHGSIVSQGVFVTAMNFRGLVEGQILRASRDAAKPLWGDQALAEWASEQAQLIAKMERDEEMQASCAQLVCAAGGDPGPLKCCEISSGFVSIEELKEVLGQRSEIWIVHDAAVSLARRHGRVKLGDNVVSCGAGIPAIIGEQFSNRYSPSVESIQRLVANAIYEVFSIEEHVRMEYDSAGVDYYYRESNVTIGLDEDKKVYKETGKFFSRDMNLDNIKRFRQER